MSVPKSSYLTKSPNVLLQDLNGEAVLLNLENGLYYGMDEISYHMYRAIISTGSLQEAFNTLIQEYEIDPDKLRRDLDEFLSQLLENGLVQYVDNLPAEG